jgi:hypothetical protein
MMKKGIAIRGNESIPPNMSVGRMLNGNFSTTRI